MNYLKLNLKISERFLIQSVIIIFNIKNSQNINILITYDLSKAYRSYQFRCTLVEVPCAKVPHPI